jgi:hypothetical protein
VSVFEQMRLAGEGGFGGSLMIAERPGLIAASVNVSKRKFKNIVWKLCWLWNFYL